MRIIYPSLFDVVTMGDSDNQEECQNNLPKTPLTNSDFLPASFKNQSHEIARDIVLYTINGKENAGPPPNQPAEAMRDLVDDMLNNRQDMLSMLAHRLEVKEKAHLSRLTGVAEEMFDDDVVTWTRIVSLHAFCGYIAKYCHTKEYIPHCAEEISNLLADFVINRLGLWIVSQGSWKAFDRQFPKLRWASGGAWKGTLVAIIILVAVVSLYFFVRGKATHEAVQVPHRMDGNYP